jgi:hypothetical protein
LLSRNPKPGTTRPEPPVDSMVNVYETTLPRLVGGHEMRRRLRLHAVTAATPALYGYGIPGRDCTGCRSGRDQRTARRRVVLRQQPASGTS